jgi:hypothetical protein
VCPLYEDEDPDELERRAKRIRAEREAERLRLQGEGPLLFNVVQTCGLLGRISRQKLYRLIHDGQIYPVKIGIRTYFTMDELQRFVKEHQQESDEE